MAKRAASKPKSEPKEPEVLPAEVLDDGKEMTYTESSADPDKGSEEFDPRLNLRSVTAGVWRYICKDIKNVKDEVFESALAQQYGIRKNDMIFLVANKKHRIVVV